jgi:hypothetical protein
MAREKKLEVGRRIWKLWDWKKEEGGKSRRVLEFAFLSDKVAMASLLVIAYQGYGVSLLKNYSAMPDKVGQNFVSFTHALFFCLNCWYHFALFLNTGISLKLCQKV